VPDTIDFTDRLVAVEAGHVVLTERGREALGP